MNTTTNTTNRDTIDLTHKETGEKFRAVLIGIWGERGTILKDGEKVFIPNFNDYEMQVISIGSN